jgi:hypothetical protein
MEGLIAGTRDSTGKAGAEMGMEILVNVRGMPAVQMNPDRSINE